MSQNSIETEVEVGAVLSYALLDIVEKDVWNTKQKLKITLPPNFSKMLTEINQQVHGRRNVRIDEIVLILPRSINKK